MSEPFYRATAVEPMAVVRRRHLISRKGRELVGLDDEVFDQEAIDEAGLPIAGEGALLAALERNRTGRMGDIVATIQAEQDEAIRAEVAGPLVVAGGPGTGKTAVALHRAAYLLYTFRRRLGAQGVLLVGPSPVFLRYIEHVLPSLGEQDVQLSTIAGLRPQRARAAAPSPTRPRRSRATRAWRGSSSARSPTASDRSPTTSRSCSTGCSCACAAARPRASSKACNAGAARTTSSVRSSRSASSTCWSRATRRRRSARTSAAPTTRRRRNVTSIFDRDNTLDASVAGALVRGEALARRLGAGAARAAAQPPRGEGSARTHVAGAVGRRADQRPLRVRGARAIGRATACSPTPSRLRCTGARARDVTTRRWTEDDVALIDEADARLGPVEAARPRARRRAAAATRSSTARHASSTSSACTATPTRPRSRAATASAGLERQRRASLEPRTFGHVLVDEAQDLTSMQWRMLTRRCPSGSMTLVGDPGQASRPGALASWSDALAHLPQHTAARFVTLTINYRTPAEVMEVAARLLAVAAPTVEPSRSVRSTGEQPQFVTTSRRSPDRRDRRAAPGPRSRAPERSR